MLVLPVVEDKIGLRMGSLLLLRSSFLLVLNHMGAGAYVQACLGYALLTKFFFVCLCLCLSGAIS